MYGRTEICVTVREAERWLFGRELKGGKSGASNIQNRKKKVWKSMLQGSGTVADATLLLDVARRLGVRRQPWPQEARNVKDW